MSSTVQEQLFDYESSTPREIEAAYSRFEDKIKGMRCSDPETYLWVMAEAGEAISRIATAIASDMNKHHIIKPMKTRLTGDYFEILWNSQDQSELDAYIYRKEIDLPFIQFAFGIALDGAGIAIREEEFRLRLESEG